jgi:magnesium transporter
VKRRHGPSAGRLIARARKPPGSSPGTLFHTGRRSDQLRIDYIDYDESEIREEVVSDIGACLPLADGPSVTWINVDGLHEPSVLETIAGHFDFHPLVLEDVLNTSQRPKVEDYGDYFFVTMRMLSFDAEKRMVLAEQVSLIVGDHYVFSFGEQPGDVFEPVRERLRQGKGRIRSRGPDYLAYALIDTVVDNYFRILEEIGDEVDALEEIVLRDPSLPVMHSIHHLKREVLLLRRSVWPLREATSTLYRGDVELVSEETRVYFSDVHDHATRVMETVESLRDLISSAMDLHMSAMSNRMNEIMKVLTIISTIFIPLSFFAGVYGMNFVYMPELRVRWAYPAVLAFMLGLTLTMLWYFRRKGWIGADGRAVPRPRAGTRTAS